MLFPDIQSAVEDAYSAEREIGFPSLYGMRSPVAFFAAQKIIERGDAALLEDCPPWLVVELYSWLDALNHEGKLIFRSSVGSADHTSMATRLAELLPPKTSHKWPLALEECLWRYPSGRVHQHFTHYLSATDGAHAIHGLHREYSETGALTEIEYRHGVRLGLPRTFDEGGREFR